MFFDIELSLSIGREIVFIRQIEATVEYFLHIFNMMFELSGAGMRRLGEMSLLH